MTQQEEFIISAMHDSTVSDLDQIGQEISVIEDLLTKRRLLRKWVQDTEGADLFSEDLAKVEAQLAGKEEKREPLMEEYNRYERRLNWLKKQLAVTRFRSAYEPEENADFYDVPF
jgi:hypothetical protein